MRGRPVRRDNASLQHGRTCSVHLAFPTNHRQPRFSFESRDTHLDALQCGVSATLPYKEISTKIASMRGVTIDPCRGLPALMPEHRRKNRRAIARP